MDQRRDRRSLIRVQIARINFADVGGLGADLAFRVGLGYREPILRIRADRTAQPAQPAACLGADLATGRRGESAHLATVPVRKPGECGDLRDALAVTAAAHPATGRTGCSLAHAARPARRPADRIDLRAAALFGPPDRHPQARLVEALGGRERGEARRYLEGTAASRWLPPWAHAILAWEETSGYGAVERSRAGRGARAGPVPPLGCVVGAWRRQ